MYFQIGIAKSRSQTNTYLTAQPWWRLSKLWPSSTIWHQAEQMKLQTAEFPNIIQHHLWILWVPHFLHYFFGGIPRNRCASKHIPSWLFWRDCFRRACNLGWHCQTLLGQPVVQTPKTGCVSSSLTNPGGDQKIRPKKIGLRRNRGPKIPHHLSDFVGIPGFSTAPTVETLQAQTFWADWQLAC